MAIIEVNHVTKEFRLGTLTGLKQTAGNVVARLRGQPAAKRPVFKALDDVDFKVEEGEVLGIIGHNGAGKSTLLKLLANITSPTHGEVKVEGKVAPLIEVGAGLVPDLTGRENIFLNGAILGIPKAEIRKKFDEIVAFAELEEFIDTPIKRYSSGMSVRLGFAIATSIDADILIVDEVLAVGDLAFQRKCFDRMEEIIKRQGKTVLLVSHNIRQIERLCSRAILLDHGKTVIDGEKREVCEQFYQRSNAKIASNVITAQIENKFIRKTGEIELESLTLIDHNGKEAHELSMGKPISIRCVFNATRTAEQAEVIFGFHTTDFFYIASMGNGHIVTRPNIAIGRNVVECHLNSLPLMPGVYCLRLGILDKFPREMYYGEMLKTFVVRTDKVNITKMPSLGIVYIPAEWSFNDAAS